MNQYFHSPARRKGYNAVALIALLSLIGLAVTIPFVWESKSLWYKTGMDRTLLQAGKVIGLCAAILLFLQVILALKLVPLDRVYGLDRLYLYHRNNGILVLFLAFLHGLLVIIPEGIQNIPFGWKFWPEMVGEAMVLLLIGFVAAALYQRRILPYHLWRVAHRPMGYIFAIALAVHVFFVSDSFAEPVPKYALWLLLVALLGVVILTKVQLSKKMHLEQPVKSCTMLNDNVLSLNIAAPAEFNHAPGQFCFLKLHGNGTSQEEHPFTIASAPPVEEAEDHTIQFLIKKSGDWTSAINPESLESASFYGPYGLFSYLARPPVSMLVFIAGGIGITPLLSMIRHLSNTEEPPRIMLIWSLSLGKDLILQDELKDLQEKMPEMSFHPFYTRKCGGRRIDQEQLRQLLGDIPEDTQFYMCGPEAMMVQTWNNLRDLGFESSRIFWERFAL